jgi:hypothetical protein
LQYQKCSGTCQTKFEPITPFPSGRLFNETPGLLSELREIVFIPLYRIPQNGILREKRRSAYYEEEREKNFMFHFVILYLHMKS